MKVTGYQLRQAIDSKQIDLEAARERFNRNLFQFSGEGGEDPLAIGLEICDLELDIVQLQAAQAEYNVSADICLGADKMTIAEAVKRVGVYERMRGLWKSAMSTTQGSRSYFDYDRSVRSRENEYAEKAISDNDAKGMAKDFQRDLSEIRAAIAKANTVEREMDRLDPEWFE